MGVEFRVDAYIHTYIYIHTEYIHTEYIHTEVHTYGSTYINTQN